MQKNLVFGFAVSFLLVLCFPPCQAQPYPTGFRKINSITEPNIIPAINGDASFGIESSAIGDLDDDGVVDLAVGATNQDGEWIGALYILFMTNEGHVKSSVILRCTEPANEQDSFGSSICALGDLDDDGVEDIGVGAGYDSDGAFQAGALWILFMRKDGTVKAQQKISSEQGGFNATLDERYVFGTGSSAIGDLDGDGNLEIAVGARYSGKVFVLFLNDNGTVKKYATISSSDGLPIDMAGLVGYKVAGLGDVDGDGVPDLAIGGHRSDTNGSDSGVIFIVFLKPSGGVKGFTTIAPGLAGFSDTNASLLGVGLVGIGDFNGDGIPDLVTGGSDRTDGNGAIWYVMLNSTGTVKSLEKIGRSPLIPSLNIRPGDFFGGSVSYLGDINHDGIPDVAVGAFLDSEGGSRSGAMWISTLRPCVLHCFAGNDSRICSIQKVQMSATADDISTGKWSVVTGQGTFSSFTDPDATVTDLGIGENEFEWVVTADGCPSASDKVVITVDKVVPPDAGEDKIVCEGTLNIDLEGNTPNNMIGEWSVVKGGSSIRDQRQEKTVATDPTIGDNTYMWTFLESEYCPAMKDMVNVVVQKKPIARILMPDTTFVCASRLAIEADDINHGQWEIVSGNGEINDPDSPRTELVFSKDKPVELSWTTYVDGCLPEVDNVIIAPFDLEKIPNVITPNEDGRNDLWRIPGIELISNQIRVYNRWGEEVLKTSKYSNNWGQNISNGMYFFVVTVEGCEPWKGWLSVVR